MTDAALRQSPTPGLSLPPIAYTLSPLTAVDLPFVRATWRESYKQSRRQDRLPWSAFKLVAGRQIDALLARADTRVVAAYADDGAVLGWVAWSPGRSISTLHYVYVRHSHGALPTRHHGIATALLEAAQLGKRCAYSFHGPKRQRGADADEMLVAWARSRGVFATYVSAEEFLK